MADLTFPELQQKMQLGKQKKQGVSYSFRNVEDITTKFKELDSGWILKFEDCDPIELQGRLFYKSVAIASNGDEVHRAPGYAELSEVPVIHTKKGTTIQQMQVPQWTGAVSSYARKYAVQGLFAIGEKDVDEYPVEENQQQEQSTKQSQSNQQPQQNQVRYIDNIQYQEILKTVEEFATVKGAPFDVVANFVMGKYQIQDFHQVPVDGYNVVMEYLNTQIQKAYAKQGV
ncbi:ERF family protein [Streptococcus canis]|uniref:ERF family protein n=1 Tax=Streptococcus TaxID=1301 RepID=UPI0010C288C6|nr:essential recombination function protein [Streptococcus phage Javan91]QBX31945.1 essential recombination function protein [Streptococcus phage Javan88]